MPRSGNTTEDIRKDLTSDQLIGIGEVAMAWNEVEFLLDIMVGTTLVKSQALWLSLASRLAFEAKKDLAEELAIDALLPAISIGTIKTTLADLFEYKTYRDAIVHARVFSKSDGIGQIVKRGAVVYQSLLTKKALEAFYDRLVLLRQEMNQLVQIYYGISRTNGAGLRVLEGPYKRRREQEFLGWTEKARNYQTERKSLPPLPEFPA
jgi:hypothetical protein